MSSYMLSGDDILLGGALQKFGKFVKKQTSAASTTIARFDPTAKSSKYGNITKGVLQGVGLAAATVLTGGAALGAAGVTAGLTKAVTSGMNTSLTPVRTPPKTIAPDLVPNETSTGTNTTGTTTGPLPQNSFTDTTTVSPQMNNAADASIAASFGTSSKKDNSSLIVIACLVASAGALLLFSMKKGATV